MPIRVICEHEWRSKLVLFHLHLKKAFDMLLCIKCKKEKKLDITERMICDCIPKSKFVTLKSPIPSEEVALVS